MLFSASIVYYPWGTLRFTTQTMNEEKRKEIAEDNRMNLPDEVVYYKDMSYPIQVGSCTSTVAMSL